LLGSLSYNVVLIIEKDEPVSTSASVTRTLSISAVAKNCEAPFPAEAIAFVDFALVHSD
jgi:hypothetical protein